MGRFAFTQSRLLSSASSSWELSASCAASSRRSPWPRLEGRTQECKQWSRKSKNGVKGGRRRRAVSRRYLSLPLRHRPPSQRAPRQPVQPEPTRRLRPVPRTDGSATAEIRSHPPRRIQDRSPWPTLRSPAPGRMRQPRRAIHIAGRTSSTPTQPQHPRRRPAPRSRGDRPARLRFVIR